MQFEAFSGQSTDGLTLREVLESGETYTDGDFLIVQSMSEHQKCYRCVFQDGTIHFIWKNSPAGRICKGLFDQPLSEKFGFAFMINQKLKTLGVFGLLKDVTGVWSYEGESLVFTESASDMELNDPNTSDVSAPPNLPSPTPSKKGR